MPEASMYTIFNSKVSEFNAAVKDKDVDAICDTGYKMIDMALSECSKTNINSSLKETYRKQSLNVVNHLVKYAKKGENAAYSQGPSSSSEGTDPYYSEKSWFSDEVPQMNFTNIIGVQEVKDAFMVDIVAPLRSEFRDIYHKFRGDELGSQILLWGPPGTGKTHIVKCLAGALNCKIAVVQTSEVLASVVGVAEKNIKDIFDQASELDRCIIFFDEIDSLCSDRNSDDSRHTKSILTTLLTCMDGFVKTTGKNQLRIIVAATNLPWKLDSAVKRGGRFETQIYVPLPDARAREKFVDLYLGDIPREANVTTEYLAGRLDGYAGADIKAIIKQIANQPLRREVTTIMHGGKEKGEKITVADCEKVLSSYINGVTEEMLLHFEAYDKGISYEELIRSKQVGK